MATTVESYIVRIYRRGAPGPSGTSAGELIGVVVSAQGAGGERVFRSRAELVDILLARRDSPRTGTLRISDP